MIDIYYRGTRDRQLVNKLIKILQVSQNRFQNVCKSYKRERERRSSLQVEGRKSEVQQTNS